MEEPADTQPEPATDNPIEQPADQPQPPAEQTDTSNTETKEGESKEESKEETKEGEAAGTPAPDENVEKTEESKEESVAPPGEAGAEEEKKEEGSEPPKEGEEAPSENKPETAPAEGAEESKQPEGGEAKEGEEGNTQGGETKEGEESKEGGEAGEGKEGEATSAPAEGEAKESGEGGEGESKVENAESAEQPATEGAVEGEEVQPAVEQPAEVVEEEQPQEDMYLEIKMHLLEIINKERAEVNAPPLEYDPYVSSLGDNHCRDMCEHHYLSHYDLKGHTPYQRYGLEGLSDHVSDNIGGFDYPGADTDNTSNESIMKAIEDIHNKYMNGASDTTNRQTVLDNNHTHLGIGICALPDCIRFTEIYLDRYTIFQPISKEWYKQTPAYVYGTSLNPDLGPSGALVYYDPLPSTLKPGEASRKEGYPDFGIEKELVVWPWDISYDASNRTFVFPLNLEAKYGIYYIQVFYNLKDSIAYDEPTEGASVPAPQSILGGSLILEYKLEDDKPKEPKENQYENVQVRELAKSMFVTDIKIIDSSDNVPDNYVDKINGDPPEEPSPFQLLSSYDQHFDPITTITLLRAKNEEEVIELPENTSEISYNFGRFEEPRKYVYLAVKRDPEPETQLVDIMLSYGDTPVPPDYFEIELPIQIPVKIIYKLFTLPKKNNLEPNSEEEGEEDEKQQHSPESNDSEERDMFTDPMVRIDELQRKVMEAQQINAALKKKNESLQRKVVKIVSQENNMDMQLTSNNSETERRYMDTLDVLSKNNKDLEELQQDYDQQALEIKEKYDDKEARAEEISDSFMKLKREIARQAENSHTGKPIPDRVILQFEDAEEKKNAEVEQVRLQYLNVVMRQRKAEKRLKEKEQLGGGLHLIDFEQLKIENQTLNEKIEERNEELHKLRKKTTTTVHMLTHTREKLQFIEKKHKALRDDLADLTGILQEERDDMGKNKQIRDRMRIKSVNLHRDQGFLQNKTLVTDYENRRLNIIAMKERVEELRSKHAYLTKQIKEANRKLR